MKALKIIGKIILGFVLLLVSLIVIYMIGSAVTDRYNKTFPEKYIREKYPDAVVLDSGYTGGFLFDHGNFYYELLDEESGLRFYQEFKETGLFGRFKPEDDDEYMSYVNALEQREQENKAAQAVEDCIAGADKSLEAEHFIKPNPLGTTGIVIVTKNESAENIDRIMRTLNKEITAKYKNDFSNYITYTIICCDETLYSKLKAIDYGRLKNGKTGQCDIYDLAENIGVELCRITFKDVPELDYEIFNAPGDINDDEYRPPEEFDETAICIWGEVNSLGEQHMQVFGINY